MGSRLCGCRKVLGLEGLQVLLSQKLLVGRFWDGWGIWDSRWLPVGFARLT